MESRMTPKTFLDQLFLNLFQSVNDRSLPLLKLALAGVMLRSPGSHQPRDYPRNASGKWFAPEGSLTPHGRFRFSRALGISPARDEGSIPFTRSNLDNYVVH